MTRTRVSTFRRNDVLHAVIRSEHVTKRVSLGIKIPNNAQLIKVDNYHLLRGPNAAELNAEIMRKVAELEENPNRFMVWANKKGENGRLPSLSAAVEYFLKDRAKDVSESTLKNYSYGLSRAVDVIGGNVPMLNFTDKEYATKKIALLDESLSASCSEASRKQFINIFLVFTSWFSKNYFVDIRHSHTTRQIQKKAVVAMDLAQFDEVFRSEYDDEYYYCSIVAKVALVTALRVKDLFSLKESMYKYGTLYVTTSKTGAAVKVKVPEQLMADFFICIKNYKAHSFRNELPLYMKKFESMHELVEVSLAKRGTGKRHEGFKPLYELATPHMLRRSSITYLLERGVSERSVRALSGHTHDSKSFHRYIAHVEKRASTEVDGAFSDLF